MSAPLNAAAFIAALKAEGLVVHEYRDWKGHTRSGSGRPWGPVHGVVMHHTASGSDGIVEYCYTGSSALPGPLCHGVIDKKGEVWLVGYGRTNHAGGGDPDVLNAVKAESYMTSPPAPHEHEGSAGAVDGNKSFYGFECVNHGSGNDPWPKEQTTAMVKAAAAICRVHGWSAKSVIGHKEWSDWKNDPNGIAMPLFRVSVEQCLKSKAGVWPAAEEKSVATAYTDVMRTDAVPVDTSLDQGGTWTAQTALSYLVEQVRLLKADIEALKAK